MKSFTAVVVCVLALGALASSRNVVSKYADKDFLVRQKFILDIYQHIYQDDVFATKFDSSFYEYAPWDHVSDYHHLELLQPFFDLWQHKPMLDDEVFSIFYERHVEYAHGLTRLFFFAKDWETFTHAVFWARTHVNKHLFVYALTAAALHRPDLTGVVLPAPYEVQPWFFFDAETLEVAEKYKMHGFHNVRKLDNIYNVVIRSNYSNFYGDVNDDHNLAYYLEDVGFNAFYYYFNMDYPYPTKGAPGFELNKDRRGEFYLYVHWQLLARYYLERLSHDLGEVPVFNMYEDYETGYYSDLHYYRGMNFPDRHNHYNFYHPENYEAIRHVETYTQRIMDWVHKNTLQNVEAVNVLGNMLQGNADSEDVKYYGSLDRSYRHIVNEGHTYGKYREVLPNQFMHYETSMRDPLFYSMYKEIVSHYWHLMETYPEYTVADFVFDGVTIDSVHMPERLTTFFESFDSDISNAVLVEAPVEHSSDVLVNFGRNSHYNGESYVIKARQQRLTHKPFEFSLDVTSEKAQPAVVKVFVGPKYDEHGHALHLEENYMNFFELDHFRVDLVAGKNVIKRNSVDFSWWVNDRTTYLELYQKVMDAYNSDYQFPLNQLEAHCGVPNRMMIPRGKKGGMPYTFFFMVYPFHEPAVKQYTGYDPSISCGVGSGARFVDSLPFGFPFNRPVKHDYYFNVHNFVFHDVAIYHKEETTNVV
jgi:hypothetical protein